MAQEYELIRHGAVHGLQLFLVNIFYRTPHLHRDFELVFVLRGTLFVDTGKEHLSVPEGSFLLMNPFQLHEFRSDSEEGTLIMPVQVSPRLIASCVPEIDSLRFPLRVFSSEASSECAALFAEALSLAEHYFLRDEWFALRCTARLLTIFYRCLLLDPPLKISAAEQKREASRKEKLRFLSAAIDDHYTEKIRLSDLADALGVSQYYLSHFFKENFGMSFLDYLSALRCEHAARELLATDHPLLDICFAAGFSDPKYYQQAFRSRFGLSPREYRARYKGAQHVQPKESRGTAHGATVQEFPDESESLSILRALRQSGSRSTPQ